jgi:hypothetical protein
MRDNPSPEYLNAVSLLMTKTREYLNALQLIPRKNAVDPVILGLLSKSIVLTESIVLLVANGFHDEAFGGKLGAA